MPYLIPFVSLRRIVVWLCRYDRHESSEINFWIPITDVFGKSSCVQLKQRRLCTR